MPSTRHTPSDPFTTAPLRHPTIAPPNLRSHTNTTSNTSTSASASTSTASSRSRQNHQPSTTNLFASTLSRKPTASSRRGTPSLEDDVLADEASSAAEEPKQQPRRPLRHTQKSRHGFSTAHASSESKLARAQLKARQEREREEEAAAEFVVRKTDGSGSFLREIEGLEAALSAHLQADEVVDEADVRALDEGHGAAVRHYFTSAPLAGTGRRAGEKHERNFEEYYPGVSSRLRQEVLEKLEGERWRYEAVGGH